MSAFTLLCSTLITFFISCLPQDQEVDYDCYFYGDLPAYLEEPWKPQCKTLYGRIVINAESNLTEARLEKLFRNVTSLVGKVAVEQTLLKRLSFLKNVVSFSSFDEDSTLSISENALLTQLNLDKLTSSDGKLVVVRNSLLNMSNLCDRMDRISNGYRMIAGNKADCGFQYDATLTFTSILVVPPNLSIFYGDLTFDDTAIPPERLAVFSSVKKIVGCLTIQRTNFETLNFLKNLEEIDCRSKFHSGLSVYRNHYLVRLGLPKLRRINTAKPIQVESNRVLEIAYEEMEVVLNTNVSLHHSVEGRFPVDDLPPEWCAFKSWEDDLGAIPDNCTTLVGVLDYHDRAFSDQELGKLRQLRQIYGNINLYNVRITNLSMFSALESIISLNATYPAIGVASIPSLESIELPNLRAAYTSPAAAKFDVGSSLNINITLEFCAAMERILGEPVQIDMMNCDEWYEWKESLDETSP